MRGVHLISGQELARAECLSSENCFHVSCSWPPGGEGGGWFDCNGSDPLALFFTLERKNSPRVRQRAH